MHLHNFPLKTGIYHPPLNAWLKGSMEQEKEKKRSAHTLNNIVCLAYLDKQATYDNIPPRRTAPKNRPHHRAQRHRLTGEVRHPHCLAREAGVAVGEGEVCEVGLSDGHGVGGGIDAVSPAGGTDVGAVDFGTEGHHVLMHHAADEGVAAWEGC